MRKNILKIVSAIVFALVLAVPAVSAAPDSDAAAKAPELTFTHMEILPDSTQQIYIEKNKAKILKTTWGTSKKSVVNLAKKKKTSVNVKSGGAGDTSAMVTAKVKYKLGGKVKTKKLTCKVKVVWLGIDAAGAMTDQYDSHTVLTVYFNQLAKNINKYDVVPEEGEVYIAGEWTTNAGSVVEVTDASGSAVAVEKVSYLENRGPRLWIDLGTEITEKTSYHVTLMGFKGCGSKMIIQKDIDVKPIDIVLSQIGFLNPENKGDISLAIAADPTHLFNVNMPEYDKANNTYLKVIDENGKELEVVDIIPVTREKEGDHIIINLKGGADSKKFTVEMTNAFMANFGNPTSVYNLLTKTLVVDNYTPNGY